MFRLTEMLKTHEKWRMFDIFVAFMALEKAHYDKTDSNAIWELLQAFAGEWKAIK